MGSWIIMVPVLIGWLSLIATWTAWAEPYRPTDDSYVLERLTFNATDPVAREIRALRTDLAKDPRNLGLAVKLATRYVERGRSEGDPRLLGKAQAALAPWWNESSPPPAALLLRAIIRQNVHEFDLALADLDELLHVQPTNPQAWLTKASILQVQARYEEARKACQPLLRLTAQQIALTCTSDIAGLTGQADHSMRVLEWIVAHPSASLRERQWSLVVLAELAVRTGKPAMAEQYFLDASRIGSKDQYLLAAHADLLLDQGRAHEVLTLLKQETGADGLLLRLALAEQALRLPAATDHRAMLAARFAASRDRGSRLHLREEARFTLALLHDPQHALPLAQANWSVQREPADARVLLESALAARNREAAQPVLDWLNRHHIEDRHLRHLAKQFEEGHR